MAIQWSIKYSVGVDFVDDQHKRIFEYVDKAEVYFKAYKAGLAVSKDDVRNLINELKEYTIRHFNDEEMLMKRANYPQLSRHQEIHRKLIASLGMLEKKFDEHGLGILEPLAEFLTKWLTEHIAGVDRKYAPYIGKRAAI